MVLRRATRNTDAGIVERDDSSRTVLRVTVQQRDSSGTKLLWRPTEHTSNADNLSSRLRALLGLEPILDRFSEGVAVRLGAEGVYEGPASPDVAAGALRRVIDETLATLQAAPLTSDGHAAAVQALANLRASPTLAVLAVEPLGDYLSSSGYVFPVDTTVTVETMMPFAAFKTQVPATEEIRIRREGAQGEFLRFELVRRPKPDAIRRVMEQFAASSRVSETLPQEDTFTLEATAFWQVDLRTGLVRRFERHARAVFGGKNQEGRLVLEML